MSEWLHTTIGDVITLQRGFDITKATQRPGRVPVVSSGGISSFHDTAISDGPGVVMGRKGTLGKVFYLPGPYWPHDTTLWVKDFKGNYPRFVYYFLQTLNFLAMDVGSSNPTLNRNHVHPLHVRWPTRLEQEAIADALGALDDKIAVNDRVAGKMDDLSTALFEEATTNCPQASLANIATPVLGATPDRTVGHYWGGTVPWASAKDVANSSFGVVATTEERITDDAAQETRAKPVPPGSVVLTARGTVGAVARVIESSSFNQSCYAFIPGRIPPGVLFHTIRMASEHMLSIAHGTVFSTVNMKTFSHVVVPSFTDSQLPALEGKLTPLHRGIEQRLLESMALRRMRDTLLPELMSGRLRIRDAEKVVEEAV